MTDQDPQVQPDGDPQVQPTGEGGFPIGMAMPFPESPTGLPRPLWEAHTSESWARAIQAELLQQAAEPISGVTVDPEKPFDPGSTVFEHNIKFACVNLGEESSALRSASGMSQPPASTTGSTTWSSWAASRR